MSDRWQTAGHHLTLNGKSAAKFGPTYMVELRIAARALNAHDDLIRALQRLLGCPALNLDALENEDLAAIRQAEVTLRGHMP